MMGKCGSCGHWGESPNHGEPITACPPALRHCGLLYPSHAQRAKFALVEAGDYASSSGALMTAAEFGCVEWEAKR